MSKTIAIMRGEPNSENAPNRPSPIHIALIVEMGMHVVTIFLVPCLRVGLVFAHLEKLAGPASR